MIHRYIVEFNIDQNHVENDPGRFFDFLDNCLASQKAKLELIHKSKVANNEIISVSVVPQTEPLKTKLKTLEQQMASLRKGK